MGGKNPMSGGAKPDLVAVILERSVAEQLALALAWALGSTGGGGKSKGKGGSYQSASTTTTTHDVDSPKVSNGSGKP